MADKVGWIEKPTDWYLSNDTLSKDTSVTADRAADTNSTAEG